MEKLNFNVTMSVDRFKSVNNINSIDVVKNPNTGKLFFTCPQDSSISGKIAKEIDFNGDLAISQCTGTEAGEEFYMLHNHVQLTDNVQHTL